jgi:hypothetical protein
MYFARVALGDAAACAAIRRDPARGVFRVPALGRLRYFASA